MSPARSAADNWRGSLRSRPAEASVAGLDLAEGEGILLPGLGALDAGSWLDSRLGIEHEAAAGDAADGVEIGFGEFGDLAKQQRQAEDELAQGSAVEGRFTVPLLQLGGDGAGGVDQLVGFCVGCGNEAERCAAAGGGVAPAEPDRDDVAEIGITYGADEKVGAAVERERRPSSCRPSRIRFLAAEVAVRAY